MLRNVLNPCKIYSSSDLDMKIETFRYQLFVIFFLITALFMQGCAVINVPLLSQEHAFKERVIEGKGKDKILVLNITGIISEKKRSSSLFSRKASIIEEIKEALNKAAQDKKIKGIILRINSPGGTITATDILHHELITFKKDKKITIIACLMGMSTSGGYYLATAADEIIAHPTTITGSIGVMVLKFNVEKLLSRIGIEEETVKSSEMKDIWSPFRPTTKEERKVMQTIIDKYHKRFVDVIRNGRNLPYDDVDQFADGRIFTADQALKKKMIDRIGYMDDAVKRIKESLGISKASVITYYRPGSYKGSIYSSPFPAGPQIFNLIAIDGEGLTAPHGVHFMYLWLP